MFGQIIETIVNFIGDAGYLGIFVMMFIESSFIPFPSEVVMIPAGYLVYRGDMNAVIAVIAGVAGSLAGALLNYWLALRFGREFLIRFGKYFFFTESSMQKMESYFTKHGEISTFVGRLIMGVRQYISLPAGLARMNLAKFCFYTSLGAGIWVVILVLIGYYIGVFFGADFEIAHIIHAFTSKDISGEESTIKNWTRIAGYSLLVFVCVVSVVYVLYWKFKKPKKD
ncbi:DedA family protein [uncultured Helicobacter sp.]|uniref:DedA family protein n=1 Tax=uncultured Helicobacter sp. TaxID=175537 RepID=UPI001C3BC7DA|nr:DedA family protein [Candidatus Helicobacter avicola]